MRRGGRSILILLAMVAPWLAAPLPLTAQTRPSTDYARAFQDLYDYLGENYCAFELKQIDWQQVGGELLPEAEGVASDDEFGRLCLRLVARLQDSHAQLLPGSADVPQVDFPRWDPGFACLIDDQDQPVVYHVDRNSPAFEAGIRPGMRVLRVNNEPAGAAIERWMKLAQTWSGYSSERACRYDAARNFCRQMARGQRVRLVLQDVDGTELGLNLPSTLGVRYLPRLPVPIEGIDDSADVSWTRLGGGIGYIYVRRIRGGLEGALNSAVRELKGMQGLIVDVRGNSGGGFDAARALRNFDPDDPAEPNRPRFAGPIALLIDERCISAGEGWASWFVARKRATLFGAATAGASSRKATYTLSNGMYKVVVPVKAYRGFLDRPIERRGLEPDVPIRCSAADLSRGRDSVLEAARQFLLDRSSTQPVNQSTQPAR